MTKAGAFAGLTRTLNYLQDAEFRRDHLYIRSTGARIAIDWPFVRDFSRGLRLYFHILSRSLARRVATRFSTARTPVRIAFYPREPAPWFTIWCAAQVAGLEFTSDLHKANYIYLFDDKTVSNAADRLPAGLAGRLINDRCRDISKRHVAKVFQQVFGYSLSVDPIRHRGPAVRKSDVNAAHDGEIVTCPLPPERIRPDSVYQRLVNNSPDGQLVRDLRTVVVGGKIAVTYIKCRPIERRFLNENSFVELINPSDIYSPDEMEKVAEVAKIMGLDFGGMDVLRNEDDGRLYVVDVNKTCMGPPTGLAFRHKIEAVGRIAQALKNMLRAN